MRHVRNSLLRVRVSVVHDQRQRYRSFRHVRPGQFRRNHRRALRHVASVFRWHVASIAESCNLQRERRPRRSRRPPCCAIDRPAPRRGTGPKSQRQHCFLSHFHFPPLYLCRPFTILGRQESIPTRRPASLQGRTNKRSRARRNHGRNNWKETLFRHFFGGHRSRRSRKTQRADLRLRSLPVTVPLVSIPKSKKTSPEITKHGQKGIRWQQRRYRSRGRNDVRDPMISANPIGPKTFPRLPNP